VPEDSRPDQWSAPPSRRRASNVRPRGHSVLLAAMVKLGPDRLTITVEDGNPVFHARHSIPTKPAPPWQLPRQTSGNGADQPDRATWREVAAWSNVRDGGEPFSSILDECSRPGRPGARRSRLTTAARAERPGAVNQSSFPSYSGHILTVTLLLPTRGTPRRLRAPFARTSYQCPCGRSGSRSVLTLSLTLASFVATARSGEMYRVGLVFSTFLARR